jgi:ribonucleoside-diphosphate reductase beta chain
MGIVNENVCVNLYKDIQSAEARAFYAMQILIETIHAETYSLLIDTYIKDPAERNRLFNGLDNLPVVTKKGDWAMRWMNSDASFATKLIAFMCVEGVFFSSSFASIFYLKKRGLMPGLTFSNELISRDEGLHCAFACEVYKMLENPLSEDTILQIFKEAVEIEKEFVSEALKVRLIGMNEDLMHQYVEYVADFWLYQLGLPKQYNTANPFDFMAMISYEGKTNFFEKKVGEYRRAGVGNTAEEETFSTDADF